jgi:hypothetical protein
VLVVIDCDSEPEVPVTTRLMGPGDTPAFAWIATVCAVAPGVTANVLGVAVTPAGSPERTTLTALENPFAGTTEMEMV